MWSILLLFKFHKGIQTQEKLIALIPLWKFTLGIVHSPHPFASPAPYPDMLRIPTLTLLFFVLSNFSKPHPLPLSVLPSKLSPSHSVSISLGSPPIDVALIVDSGSHHLALPCSHDLKKGKGKGGDYEVGKSISAAYHDCESCPHETHCDGGFCVHTQGYSEGSKWTSKTVTDKVSNLGVESKSLIESTIYCITEQVRGRGGSSLCGGRA
jgi:hypothetical protein